MTKDAEIAGNKEQLALIRCNRSSKTKRLVHMIGRVEPGLAGFSAPLASKGADVIWNLEPGWLMMAVAAVIVLALFFGAALDVIMRDDGFGPIGNMVVFTSGFFAAVLGANSWGVDLSDLKLAVACGLSGAFALVSLAAVLKAGIARI
ncbi:MAG: hypothetical protein NTV73_12920 [Hyphomicrobiales bacterium]|nr:hypothetical protein [Hyphomicrobiales bacterium]